MAVNSGGPEFSSQILLVVQCRAEGLCLAAESSLQRDGLQAVFSLLMSSPHLPRQLESLLASELQMTLP